MLLSLFEEQLTLECEALDADLSRGAESFAESVNYFPDMTTYNLGPDRYLELIRKAKASVAVRIIGSLNGISRGGWIRYAREIEQAGADAIELNIYSIATDPQLTADQAEHGYAELVAAVKQSVRIPVAVKLSPFFSTPQMRRNEWTAPVRMRLCCSIAFISRTWTSSRSKSCPA